MALRQRSGQGNGKSPPPFPSAASGGGPGKGCVSPEPRSGESRFAFPVLALLALLSACHESERHAAVVPELPELSRPIQTPAARNGGAILAIPEDLVVERGGIPGVFELRDNRARFQPVKTGRRAGGTVEVLAGLAGGEKLVGGKLTEVRDGSPIHSAKH